MNKILLCAFLFAATLGFSQETPEKYQRAKISYSSIGDLVQLESLGIPADHGIHKKGHFVISDFSMSELDRARQAGFNVTVLIEDSKEHFLQQNRLNLPATRNLTCDDTTSEDYPTPANFELGTMGGYLTYQEALNELDEMKALFPNLITTRANISNFVTNGQPDNTTVPSIGSNGIQWVKISDNPDSSSEGEAQILYTGIHHAREPITLSQLVYYMWYLLENYDTDPEVQNIINNTELYFVPVVNPDGYLFNQKTDPNGGGFWRKNRFNGHGVDNNRNYDYFINGNPADGIWGGPGASSNPNSETYHGTGPFSEIENQAIKFFVENHDFVMAFNNHSFGQLLYHPFGYADIDSADHDLFQSVGNELTSRNGYNALRDFPFAGDSDDFMYGTVGTHDEIFAFTPEIGQEFWPPSNQIDGLCKDMMYLNLTSAKMVNNFASLKDTAPQFIGDDALFDASFDIRRLGVTGNGTFTVSVNPITANIASAGSAVTFNSLALLEEDNGSIEVTLQGAVSAGDDITYELIVNNGSYDTSIEITKQFGTLDAVFSDPGNSTTDNFDNNGWSVVSSTFVSAPSSITDSPGGDYENNANETITLSDAIDLTDALGANATFYAKWEIENNWDYVQFEVSTNNGGTWTPQCGNFTNPGSSNAGQPTGEPLYDGNQADWVLEEIDLSDYLGQSILVRFQLISDGEVRRDGFYFDDLKINIVDEVILSVDDIINSQFTVFPNPVQDILQINTSLNNYQIEIYNIQGQLVASDKSAQGNSSFDYSSFASGMYLMKLTSENNTQTIKVVKE